MPYVLRAGATAAAAQRIFESARRGARGGARADRPDDQQSDPQPGIAYPPQLFAPLVAAPRSPQYHPEPFGMRSAREAVAADYARRARHDHWDRIVLTASTSEAYSLLFKLLCAPAGDRVLVPAPSYPLFDHLTALDGVGAVPYALHYDGRWWVDFDSVDAAWTARTRALLAVSPNNPTGSVLSADERRAIGATVRRRATRRSSSTRCSRTTLAGRPDPGDDARRAAAGLPDVPARRPVEVGGAAAGEARLDRGGRPRAARGRGARPARADLRHLSVGVDAGAGRRRRSDCRRRRSARTGARTRARELSHRCASSRRVPVGRGPERRRRLVGGASRGGHGQRGGDHPRAARTRRRRRLSRILLRLPARGVPGREPAAGGRAVSTKASAVSWSVSMPEPRDFHAGRHAGVLVPLFSIPSRASWGVGEIADLPRFARLAARRPGSTSCSCCRSTKCRKARIRRTRR